MSLDIYPFPKEGKTKEKKEGNENLLASQVHINDTLHCDYEVPHGLGCGLSCSEMGRD